MTVQVPEINSQVHARYCQTPFSAKLLKMWKDDESLELFGNVCSAHTFPWTKARNSNMLGMYLLLQCKARDEEEWLSGWFPGSVLWEAYLLLSSGELGTVHQWLAPRYMSWFTGSGCSREFLVSLYWAQVWNCKEAKWYSHSFFISFAYCNSDSSIPISRVRQHRHACRPFGV